VTAGYLLVPGNPERYEFTYREDDIRMLQNIEAKFIGRAIYRWSEESKPGDPAFLDYAGNLIKRMHSTGYAKTIATGIFRCVSSA
jgi:hypothetical protein